MSASVASGIAPPLPLADAGAAAGDAPALSIRRLVKEYVPGNPVLRGIDLEIPRRGMLAIIGPSGTGKSTLIR